MDSLPGAYPVKSKTGDRTRSGRNHVYFDDARTVLFLTGVNVTYPTTLQFDSSVVAYDLTSSIGSVKGNVDKYAIDQFVPRHRQVERVGAFVEDRLYEQDEHAVVNSKFMTGAAFGIASDRFKSGVSSKTAVRMEFPLLTRSALHATSSSLAYFNPASGKFETAVTEQSFNINQGGFPNTFAPILFTPYGLHYLPLNDYASSGYSGGSITVGTLNAQDAYARVTTYAGDGSDGAFFQGSVGYNIGTTTASLLNSNHAAAPSQVVSMRDKLSGPFLVEKIVVEFPIEAGPGWLNDTFGFSFPFQSDLTYTSDAGGPMITFALLRQDKTDGKKRDLIASGTFTTLNDMTSGNYKVRSFSFIKNENIAFANGVVNLQVNPSVVITGSAGVSGSNNFFTGSVKLVMEPQVTSHVWRAVVSGSSFWYFSGLQGSSGLLGHGGSTGLVPGVSFGPIARRSAKYTEAGRSALGNQFALIDVNQLNANINPLKELDTQYDNLTPISGSTYHSKVNTDVVGTTRKSPYLLYPEDDLVFCFSKHRSAGIDDYNGGWGSDHVNNPVPTVVSASHDIAISTGSFKITLYGDLIREDVEFHDTLNQRLETEELWQDVGEDPVLDQFDVSYRQELSGTYIDRFNVLNTANIVKLASTLTSSLETTQYFSNFSSNVDTKTPWSTRYQWTTLRNVEELKKSARVVSHYSTNERYWDCRIPEIFEVINSINPNYRLEGYDAYSPSYLINFILYTGTTFNSGTADRGIRDWGMTYPYEGKYQGLSQVFSDKIDNSRHVFRYRASGGGGPTTAQFALLTYGQLNYAVGDDTFARYLGGEPFGGTLIGMTYPEFVKAFYGIGQGHGKSDNQHVRFRASSDGGFVYQAVELRGWRYGMRSAFVERSTATFRRDRFGQMRDMLEQRRDTKFFDELGLTSDGNLGAVVGVKDGPVQVKFYDQQGKITDSLKTLSSNVSFEATSSVPYTDGKFSNRPDYDFSQMNISRVVI